MATALVLAAPTPVGAAELCGQLTAAIHSTSNVRSSTSTLATDDSTIILTVSAPVNEADHWKTDLDDTSIVRRLATRRDPKADEDRIDVHYAYQSGTITLLKLGRPVCRSRLAFLSLPRPGLRRLVVELLQGAAWDPVFIGDVALDDNFSLSRAFVSRDAEHLYLTGYLTLHNLQSQTLVTLDGSGSGKTYSLSLEKRAVSRSPWFVAIKTSNLFFHQPWWLTLDGFECRSNSSVDLFNTVDFQCGSGTSYMLHVPRQAILSLSLGGNGAGGTAVPMSLRADYVTFASKVSASSTQTAQVSQSGGAAAGLQLPRLYVCGDSLTLDADTRQLDIGNGMVSEAKMCPKGAAQALTGVAFNQHASSWLMNVTFKPSPWPTRSPAPSESPSPSPSAALGVAEITLSSATLTYAEKPITAPSPSATPAPPVSGIEGTLSMSVFSQNDFSFAFKGATATEATDPLNPATWEYSFNSAEFAPASTNQKFFGHPAASCYTASGSLLPGVPSPPPPPADSDKLTPRCLALHIDDETSNDDLAYAFFSIGDRGTKGDQSKRFYIDEVSVVLPAPSPSPSAGAAATPLPAKPASQSNETTTGQNFLALLTALNASQTPAREAGNPFRFRFGAGEMVVTRMDLALASPPPPTPSPTPMPKGATPAPSPPSFVGYGGFADLVSPQQLTALSCNDLYLTGTLTISDISIGTASVDSSGLTPRVGFGRTCRIVAFNGMLPIQITPQSSMIITSFAYAQSQDTVDGQSRDVFYLNVGGSYTSGNVTVIFNQVGFRTTHLLTEGGDPHCFNDNMEYEIHRGSGLCVIMDVNKKGTLYATGANNLSTITAAISGAVSSIFAYLLGHAH
ncbi:MAG TPA: hypothetical protein VMF11_00665 [Candidatus Baltobacteraceae bacterium]|nr:hypothetical protein [Candidatus Baltobacteraceae bacterium]